MWNVENVGLYQNLNYADGETIYHPIHAIHFFALILNNLCRAEYIDDR